MSKIASSLALSAAAAALLGAAALPASAACTRLGFTVNDYGKEGPTNDAKSLLDKYITKWAGEHNIAKYNTGPKSVTCELFLNFIVFDEHTCKAEATVCWDGPAVPGMPSAEANAGSAAKTSADGAPLKKVATPPVAVKPKAAVAAVPAAPAKATIETGTLPPAEAVVPAVAAPAAVAATPLPAAQPETAPAPKAAPVTAFVPPAFPAAPAAAQPATPAAPAAAPAPAAPSASSAQAIANQALEAAKRAADSAERAAAAAERAAAAATAASKRPTQPAQ